MTERTYNVLFLCTGNSARSILAEVLVGHWGRGRFADSAPGASREALCIRWGVPEVEGSEDEQKRAFRAACHHLEIRIRLFIALTLEKLDRMVLKRRADEIGQIRSPQEV